MNKTILLLCCFWAASAAAQVQVVESGTSQSPSRSRETADTSNNGNELLVSFYNQLESLKQEVQSLRGLVDEQTHQIKLLETQATARYLDIDRRLSSASPGAVETNASISAAGTQPGSSIETPLGDVRTTVPFNPVLQASSEPLAGIQSSVLPAMEIENLSEQDLYRTALNLLLEEGNSTDAITLFQNYLDRFPSGRLLPNALYWQGEALILVARYPQAAAAFERVIQEFPADAKAAGSMLKLGVVYNLMGDRGRAEQSWHELATRYPESTSENTLAKDYLNKK